MHLKYEPSSEPLHISVTLGGESGMVSEMPTTGPAVCLNTLVSVSDTLTAVSNAHPGVTDMSLGVSDTCMGVSNTRSGVSNTRAGVSDT